MREIPFVRLLLVTLVRPDDLGLEDGLLFVEAGGRLTIVDDGHFLVELLEAMLQVKTGVTHLPLMQSQFFVALKMVLALGQVGAETHAQGYHGTLNAFHAALLGYIRIIGIFRYA